MNIEDRVKKIKEIFQLYPDWRPWVVSYTSTHHVLTLELYKSDLQHRTRIFCGDCFYYSGFLGGVPLRLDIEFVEDEDKDRIVVITGNENELVIKFFRISYETNLEI